MTAEQIRTIGMQAAAICGATLYGDPKLENGIWIVGFKQQKEIIALQVNFRDVEVKNDAELYRARVDLERTMQNAILMST